jgi:FKBP-type peptidyl-prolyl cis-trans isomerase SlyD
MADHDPTDAQTSPTGAVTPRSVVTLRYRLSDAQGELLAESDQAEDFLLGSGSLLPALEEALIGQQPGAELQLQIEPEQAFGDYRADLIVLRARSELPADLDEGMQFEGLPGAAGSDDPADAAERLFTITDLTDEVAVLDGNHPLAGMALRFWIRIEAVRAASAEEAAAGRLDAAAAAATVLPRRDPDAPLH